MELNGLILSQKLREEMIKMFYEIRNTKTQENARGIAKSFVEICRVNGWKPQDCRCVWKANPENAGVEENY